MDEVTRVNALLAGTLSGDTALAALVTAWHEQVVPQSAKWVASNGTTLLVRGVYRFHTGQALRRMRRARIGMRLWYDLRLYQRSATVTGLQPALDRLSTLVDGAALPWTAGQALRRMRRARIGMRLWYDLRLYQRSATVTGLQSALDRLSALLDGAALPWTAGQALHCAITQPVTGTDTIAGVDYSFLGYELTLWALPTT